MESESLPQPRQGPASGHMAPKFIEYNPLHPAQRKKLLDVPEGKATGEIAEIAKKGVRPCKSCFVAGTLVETNRGLRTIESIEQGEQVWGRDEATGKWSLAEVEHCFQREYHKDFVSIELSSGDSFTATGSHPIWVHSGIELSNRPQVEHVPFAPLSVVDGRWVQARDLRTDDKLTSRTHADVVVQNVLLKNGEPRTVFNLQIATLATYTVAKSGVWVHNNSGGGDASDCVKKLVGGLGHPGSMPTAPRGLPATTAESVTDKLRRYLLDPNHPVGGPKAKWFKEALGFTQDNLDDLARQIKFDPAKAVQTAVTEHGTKFNQVIEIVGANGKKIDVTFAWIRNNDGVVRLVTSIPTPR